MSKKGLWRYEIHDIEGRVAPSLAKRLKADGDGWIVPPAAAPWDFGLVVLRNPPSGITPLPLFDGDKDALTAALKLQIVKSRSRAIRKIIWTTCTHIRIVW